MNDAPSLGALRRDTAARLAAISDSPDLEAARLLEIVTDRSPSRLIIDARLPVEPGVVAALETAVARRLAGEPLAYIVGRVGFHDIELNITPDVLVPRSDTEMLVEIALARLPADAKLRVADLGTGSGAIALALAHARPHWRITATDAHADALACARANAQGLGLSNVAFAEGGWYQPIVGQRFDAIVSNPPYVDAADPHLNDPALCHEPRHALVAAAHGLGDIEHLAAGAARHLRPSGLLLVEHGYTQGRDVARLFAAAGLRHIETEKDLAGHFRVSIGYA